MKIKQGDPVRVRLSNGEVVDAVYNRPSSVLKKCHHVDIGRTPYLALGGIWARSPYTLTNECRFVGPTPTVKKENSNE